MDGFECPTCKWNEYYEDEQGGVVCSACGVQSQDFIKESFELEDGMEGTAIGGR